MRNSALIGIFTGLLYFGFMFSACKHNPALPDIIDPIDTTGLDTTGQTEVLCDSNVVFFQQQVLPLLISSCAISGCHDAITHEKGIILNSYSNIIKEIKPFDLNDSEIYEKITEDKDDKVMPPPPKARMTQQQIAIIAKWIQQGAKDLSCIQSSCDTSAVGFTKDIQPLIFNTCKGCHSGAGAFNGIHLDSYDGIRSAAVSGKLYNVVIGNGISMPPSPSPKLNNCQIAKIKIWVADGAQNN